MKRLVLLTWLTYNAGAQIRADAAEQKLKDAEAQLRASGQQEAELSAGMMGSDSRQGPEADAQQERAKIGYQMQLLQQSHQDLSDRYREASSTCSRLQVAYHFFPHTMWKETHSSLALDQVSVQLWYCLRII